MLNKAELGEKLKEMKESVIFTEKEILAARNCSPVMDDLVQYFEACDSRDLTVGKGFWLMGEHFDVHRWHPPLVYGRRGDAETGEGICFAQCYDRSGMRLGMLITYVLPIVSARAIPQMINFINEHIGQLRKP